MTAAQYRECLSKLGLSVVGAAPVLGIKRRQAQRYAAGGKTGSPVAEPVAKLLLLMIEHRDLKASIEKKAARTAAKTAKAA